MCIINVLIMYINELYINGLWKYYFRWTRSRNIALPHPMKLVKLRINASYVFLIYLSYFI